mmetsp:Transcript_37118/g.73049  ORF Transcript_37118/g.73049 Transcript_37118/m.73049 type:complete len:99 (-) Transcript_37118:94-390(-)
MRRKAETWKEKQRVNEDLLTRRSGDQQSEHRRTKEGTGARKKKRRRRDIETGVVWLSRGTCVVPPKRAYKAHEHNRQRRNGRDGRQKRPRYRREPEKG